MHYFIGNKTSDEIGKLFISGYHYAKIILLALIYCTLTIDVVRKVGVVIRRQSLLPKAKLQARKFGCCDKSLER